MIGFLKLILCVYVFFMVLNTSECQVTVSNLNGTGKFLCGYSSRLECAIPGYAGGMTWKLDGTIIAQCAFGSCDPLVALPAGDMFTADEANRKFYLDIGITHADNGTMYQCDDGSVSDQTTVNIQVPPSESAFTTDINEITATSITVEAGCFYPPDAGRMDVYCVSGDSDVLVKANVTMTSTTTGCIGDCSGPNIYTATGSITIDSSNMEGNSRYRFKVYHKDYKEHAITKESTAIYNCACVCDCKIAFPCVVIVFAVLVFILEIAFCCLNKDGACCCLNKDGACCCLNKDEAFCCLNKDGACCCLNKDGACCCSNKCRAFCCSDKCPFVIAGIAVVICLGLVIGVTIYLFVGCDKCKSECCTEPCPIAFTVVVWILLVCDAAFYIFCLVKCKQLEWLSCGFCQVEPSCETKHAREPQHSNQPGKAKFARNGNNDKGRENASRTNAAPRPQPAPPMKDPSETSDSEVSRKDVTLEHGVHKRPLPGITKDKASRGLSATFDDQFDHMPSFESKNKLQPLQPNSITEEDEQKKKKKKKKRKNDETM